MNSGPDKQYFLQEQKQLSVRNFIILNFEHFSLSVLKRKRWLSELKMSEANREDPDQTASSEAV